MDPYDVESLGGLGWLHNYFPLLNEIPGLDPPPLEEWCTNVHHETTRTYNNAAVGAARMGVVQ